VEVAKALGGSFKLVILAPKTVREMTQLLKETKEWDINKSKRTNKHAKHKHRLNMHTQKQQKTQVTQEVSKTINVSKQQINGYY